MAIVTVRKATIQKQKGVVILPVKEYQKLLERAVPEYYLTGKAARDSDKLVEEGLKAERAGKTRVIKSLADLE